MGIFEGIFHPDKDKGEESATAGTPAPETAAVVAPEGAGNATVVVGGEVEPTSRVDTVTGADSAPLDLKSMTVPSIPGESSGAGEVAQSEGIGVSVDSSSSKPAAEPTDSASAESGEVAAESHVSESAVDDTHVEVAADAAVAEDPALRELKNWQETDAVDAVGEVADEPLAGSTGQDLVPTAESSASSSETDSADVVQPESVKGDDNKKDLDKVLNKAAAKEADEIDAAIAESQKPAAQEEPSPEVAETTEAPKDSSDPIVETDEAPAETEIGATDTSAEDAPTVEDTPFPAPPVELEGIEAALATEADSKKEYSGSSDVVGGADVHLDRAEYVMPESVAEKGKVVDIAKVRDNIAKTREALDGLEESLGKAA